MEVIKASFTESICFASKSASAFSDLEIHLKEMASKEPAIHKISATTPYNSGTEFLSRMLLMRIFDSASTFSFAMPRSAQKHRAVQSAKLSAIRGEPTFSSRPAPSILSSFWMRIQPGPACCELPCHAASVLRASPFGIFSCGLSDCRWVYLATCPFSHSCARLIALDRDSSAFK